MLRQRYRPIQLLGKGEFGKTLVNSQQSTVNSQQSTVNSQQSTVNSEFTIPMKRGFESGPKLTECDNNAAKL
ncbi:hypothetical protein [Microcoleus sp.]|uniref:hypothetical protein n=1 Tax=Microcoleus sp. TaxID=44472 RepID=UPI003C72F241